MHLIGQSRDISEEVALLEQLRQAQKMEAIGRLAGGVAHDFNNLLTVIAGYAELLTAPEQPSTERVVAAREISAAAERAAGLTRQLLALSRRQLAKTVAVDLNEIVRGLEPMLRRTLPENIQVELVLDAELPHVQADPSQLDQVLLNLALNARDAMPSRGRLRIETRAGDGGRSLQLLVSDTGVGMTEETRLRAFEPFFTTKASGRRLRPGPLDHLRHRAAVRRHDLARERARLRNPRGDRATGRDGRTRQSARPRRAPPGTSRHTRRRSSWSRTTGRCGGC